MWRWQEEERNATKGPGTESIHMCFLRNNFIYLFLMVLGLLCCMGFSLVAMGRLLIVVASPVEEHRFQGLRVWDSVLWGVGSVLVALSCRPQAQRWHMGLAAPCHGGDFREQGWNPHLLHWQADSSPPSHQEASMYVNQYFYLHTTQ